jgi:hypothetical protein
MTLDARFDALSADLEARLGSVTGTRDFLVYADTLYAGDGVSGVATLYNDDRPGPENWSNTGGQFAFVFSFGSSRRTTAQHELGHNLGAVQDSAPHSTLAGHCFERYDVMCYADGGTKGQTSDLVTNCNTPSQPAWDCGADDYFHPNPPVGSYLASHWNLYDSVYLCPPADCIVASESADAPPVAPAPAPASGGGGGGGGGAASPKTPTPPVTPTEPTEPAPPQVVIPAAPAVPFAPPARAATAAEQAKAALDTVEAAWPRALRRAGGVRALRAGRPVRVRMTSPSAGRLTARLTLRGRTIASTTVTVRAGRPATLSFRAGPKARKALRGARPSSVALRLALR